MIGLVVSDFPGCMKVSCRQVYAHREMCRTRTYCSFIAEACACQPVLVQLFPDVRSLLSTSLALLLSLAPFLSLFFHLPPDSSSLRNLVNILLPYTSCMSSALGAPYPIAVSVTFMTWTKIVLFVWMSRKSPLGPKHQATVGSCKC